MKPIVVLDPGHGGKDPGAVAHGLREKDINLKLAHRVAAKLDGIKVLLTRESDIYVSLKDRVALGARAEADLFVSLHANAGGGHGFESYIYQGLGSGDPAVGYRDIIHGGVMDIFSRWNIRDRGRKSAAFYVLRYNQVPAILLESLFIDNEREAGLWKEPPFVEALAGGIARGIIEALVADTGKTPVFAVRETAKEAVENQDILYTVQVGAFTYPDNAWRCLEKARDAGFSDAFIYPKKVS